MSDRTHDPSTSAGEGRPVVVVTGAGAGVGRSVAQAFARQGASLGLIGRDAQRLAQAKADVEELGGRGLILPLDVADHAALDGAAAEVERRYGPIDVWINNAMVSVFSPVAEMEPDDYRRVTDVTYLGTVWGTLAALRRMLPRDRGTIVQVGSALAHRAIPLQSAYCAAKHAALGFTDALRTELLHAGSRVAVTMVQLPAINTPQFEWTKSRLPRKLRPMGTIFQPEVAARAIVWAARHPRRESYVGWPTLTIVYGDRLAPGWVDCALASRAWDGQQTEEPADPGRRHNLWEPVPGPYGAHGRFDAHARGRSAQLWLSRNRRAVGALAVAAGLGVAWWVAAGRRFR